MIRKTLWKIKSLKINFHNSMKTIGITGRIASGKTLVANLLRYHCKGKIFNADKFVHRLYKYDQHVIQQIRRIAPGSFINSEINRKILSKYISEDHTILHQIEQIVHPIVKQEVVKLYKLYLRNKIHLFVVDIPLLYKIGANELCDEILHISVNNIIWKNRIKKRYGSVNYYLSRVNNISEKNHKIKYIKSGIEKRNLCCQIMPLLRDRKNDADQQINANTEITKFYTIVK